MPPLDPERLEGFWRFVAERQRVWVRRVVRREEPPWTRDPTLRQHRFTNVYRRLDPGTQYAICEILAREAPVADRLFNLLVYRLIGRAATHEQLGFLRVDDFETDRFETALRERHAAGAPVFTGAYVVSGYAGMGGEDKIANVTRVFDRIVDRYDGFLDDLAAASTPEAAFEAIRALPGFGRFLAFQVLVDATYPGPGDAAPLLPVDLEGWAAAGPGASRGLDRLGAVDELDAMRWLTRNQAAEFDRLGIKFPWLRDDGGDRVALSIADVQNCCCEFDKYCRVRSGEGRTRRRFRPEEGRPATKLRDRMEPLDISVDPADYPDLRATRRERCSSQRCSE